MPYVMVFGKHKGEPISAVPTKSLEYYAAWDQIRPEAKAEVEKELARRRGGDGPATGHGQAVPGTSVAGPCPSCAKLREYLFSLFAGAAPPPDEVPF